MRPWTANYRKRLLRVLLPLLTRFEPTHASRLLSSLGGWEARLNPLRRTACRNALEDLGGRLGCSWDLDQTVPKLLGNYWRWDVRDLLLDNLSDIALDHSIEVVGVDNLSKAVEAQRGVLLLFNHFGPFLIPAHWINRKGYTLRWFTERPRHISRSVAKTFQTEGPLGQQGLFLSRRMTPAQGGSSLRKAIRMLQSGLMVQAAGDVRWSGPRSVTETFLGHNFEFATNWVSLAALSGANVLPVYSVLMPGGTYRVVFEPPEQIERDAASNPELTRYWLKRNLSRIEVCIRNFPDNAGEYVFWQPGLPNAQRLEKSLVMV